MKEALLIDNWLNSKLSDKNYYRLEEVILVEYEYRRIAGPRSIYAYVQFECHPADELEFESTADWGKNLSSNYIKAVERAVCVGIIDGLFNSVILIAAVHYIFAVSVGTKLIAVR